jgi:hypothetical protein
MLHVRGLTESYALTRTKSHVATERKRKEKNRTRANFATKKDVPLILQQNAKAAPYILPLVQIDHAPRFLHRAAVNNSPQWTSPSCR